ncbi:hypothetical protein Ccrd_011969 [Cynara cardunculus var. scolymus]|uniref:S-adenosyl-L-methionine-dependent methyltransferase n=1 Tax=Cynara cardunculus var. scolymus TaxID=59895 RepID=A0A103YID8_CYNCS|nr:hypothetical protein Ccrd_011969 [Cynara cardunculus var. scolymus]
MPVLASLESKSTITTSNLAFKQSILTCKSWVSPFVRRLAAFSINSIASPRISRIEFLSFNPKYCLATLKTTSSASTPTTSNPSRVFKKLNKAPPPTPKHKALGINPCFIRRSRSETIKKRPETIAVKGDDWRIKEGDAEHRTAEIAVACECFQNGLPEPVFLTYEDTTLYRVTVSRFVGPFVGEFLVEVESSVDSNKDSRRRLRFKRMPNLIQSEIPLIRTTGNVVGNLGFLPSLREMSEVEFRVDTRVLVQPYLTVVVSGLFLIVSLLDQRMKQGFIPRALCLGVGGGALLSFLNTRLGFEVVGVEADEVVLSIARQNSIRLILGDAIELIEKVACGRMKGDTHDLQVNIDCLNAKFDVVMVDLDSSDVRTGISAPPPESVRKPFFQASKSVLHDHGFFVINVVPPDERFYVTLIQELQDVFHNVHEINIENEDKFVLVATVSPIASNDHDNAFIQKAEACDFRSIYILYKGNVISKSLFQYSSHNRFNEKHMAH